VCECCSVYFTKLYFFHVYLAALWLYFFALSVFVYFRGQAQAF
jgi:hypothetical protein